MTKANLPSLYSLLKVRSICYTKGMSIQLYLTTPLGRIFFSISLALEKYVII